MTPNAVRRTSRSGSHLTLVITDTTALDIDAESDEPKGKHAAPSVMLPIAGSATVRALMALGAVLSAVGLSIGRADAALHHEAKDKPVESQADTVPDTPDEPTAPGVAPTARIVSTAAITRTSPVRWEPASKSATTRTYMSTPVQGTGKHRRHGTVEHTGTFTGYTPGRHRRMDSQGHTNKPMSSTNTLAGVVVRLPVSNVI